MSSLPPKACAAICMWPLFVAAMLGCSGNPQPKTGSAAAGAGQPFGSGAGAGRAPSDGGGGQAGASGSAADAASGSDAAPLPDAATDDAMSGQDAGARNYGTLVDEPGDRSWQCTVEREPSALGISPWGGDDTLFRTSNGLHLARVEGGTSGAGGFINERVVVSAVGMDGRLGPAMALGADPSFRYGWITVGEISAAVEVTYAVVGPTATERRYVAQRLDSTGAPTGAAMPLSVEAATFAFVLPLPDGHLVFGGDRNDVKTDEGQLWAQRLDDAGAPTAGKHVIVQASATQRMADLAPVGGIVQTSSGFLVLYGWFAATADRVDITRYRYRLQALDRDGRPVGSPNELLPEVASHITGNPRLLARDGHVLVTWTEAERMPDPASPTGWTGEPLWSVIRVARFDESGAPVGPARTVSPAPDSRIWPGGSFWVDLDADDVGLGWYEGETDFGLCPSCWAVGKNYFVVLSSDLQSARSEQVSFSLQTADAGFVAKAGAHLGEDILVIGGLDHNLWSEAASATLRCTQ